MKQKLYLPFSVCFILLLFLSNKVVAQVKPQTLREIQMSVDEKNSRTPVERKISSQLLQAIREHYGKQMVEGLRLRPANVHADATGVLLVDINAEVSDGLLGRIKASGGTIVFSSKQFHSVRAKVTLPMAEAIATYNEVRFIKPAAIAHTQGNKTNKPPALNNQPGETPAFISAGNSGQPARLMRPSFEQRAEKVKQQLQRYLMVLGTGSVTSQGDHAMGADSARAKYGYMGEGIRVGVISDSYNSLGTAAADVASGDLPGPGNPLGNTTPVTVLQDYPGGTDEGRAMLQIVHDLAPKAQLFFASADYGEAGFASNILALRAAPNNCDIIIDDIKYYDEPAFEDGMVAQAVNTVTTSGCLYFSSAGNSGSAIKNYASIWEGDFNGVGSHGVTANGKKGSLHNFGTVGSPKFGDSIITQSSYPYYTLKWADPLGGSNNDYDLYILDSVGSVVAYSNDIQDGTQDPYEYVEPSTLKPGDVVVIFKDSTAAVRAMRIDANLDGEGVGFNYTTAGSTFGHDCAVAAFNVAATNASVAYPGVFTSSSQVEYFSSDGPRRIFYNADSTPVTPGKFTFAANGGTVRKKPDVTAADNVITTFFGPANFFSGTSAAAPHAGAVAALLKSAKPSLTPAQIRTLLTSTALDIEAPGYDYNSGYGVVQAYKAMQQLNPTPLPALNVGAINATEGALSNHDGVIEPGETGYMVVQLVNTSLANATGVSAVLLTSTPGVTITQGNATYGNIASGGSAANTTTPFTFAVNSSVPCGTVITFYIDASIGGGAASPQGFIFTFTVGSATISSTLGATAPVGNNYLAVSGQQTGILSSGATASSCGNTTPTPALSSATGKRQYDAYTFTNNSTADECVTVTLTSTNGLNIYSTAYSSAGFVAANPATNFVAEAGPPADTLQYSFTAPAGQKFTVLVNDINVLPASGSPYSLNIAYGNCNPGPACSPVKFTSTSIAEGATGKPYHQVFTASGGNNSGIYLFSLAGNLPAGNLSFAGDSLFGISTQAGQFPIVITASDPTGCASANQNDTLIIKGITPAMVTAFAGTPQSAIANEYFADTLKAKVFDSSHRALAGVNVFFAAPVNGASASFANYTDTLTVTTDSTGVAAVAGLSANGVTGGYTVTATVLGVATPANFALTNYCISTVVTNSGDTGVGSLRYIVANACGVPNITFAPGISKISLLSGYINLSGGISITGPGANLLTISGSNSTEIFDISNADSTFHVSISGLTLSDGFSAIGGYGYPGGAIAITGGTVDITGCSFINNKTPMGNGGAIDNNGGYVTINNCTFSQNSSLINPAYGVGGVVGVGLGGAIAQEAPQFSDGFEFGGGATQIFNSTIVNNQADTTLGNGGGIACYGPVTLTNCTVYGNMANKGGNIFAGIDTVGLENTIVAAGGLPVGGTGPDIAGSAGNGVVTSNGYNLIQNTTASGITLATSDITGINPGLLPLGNYGGPIQTMLPLPNSPVINKGDPTLKGSQFDQRGYTRVAAGRADIGADEANYKTATAAGTPQSAAINTNFAVAMEGKVTENNNPIKGVTILFNAPASGASGKFAGGKMSTSVTTNSSGIATAPVFTADSTTGTYTVTDSIGAAFAKAGFTLTNTNALAVIFGNVTATVNNCTVQIAWQTLTGEAGESFTVEHSTDGINYTTLYTTSGRGNSIAEETYNYTHLTPVEGANYYRIKQTDANGSVTYSSTIIVINTCTNAPVIAYPNPAHEKLTLVMPGTEKQAINVYNEQGQIVTRVASAAGTIEIDVSKWASGVYTMTVIKQDKTTYTLKVIKN